MAIRSCCCYCCRRCGCQMSRKYRSSWSIIGEWYAKSKLELLLLEFPINTFVFQSSHKSLEKSSSIVVVAPAAVEYQRLEWDGGIEYERERDEMTKRFGIHYMTSMVDSDSDSANELRLKNEGWGRRRRRSVWEIVSHKTYIRLVILPATATNSLAVI